MTKSGRKNPVERYALIGDCETAALVGLDGSIDWLCWPDFSSDACFTRLLGDKENGYWQIAPSAPILATSRKYREHTLILETTFETRRGAVTVTDFMPIRGANSDVVRIVKGVRGVVPMRMELAVRFGYGRIVPWATSGKDGWVAIAGPDLVILRTEAPLQGEDLVTVSEFTVRAGEHVSFVMTYGESFRKAPRAINVNLALKQTQRFWSEWTSRGKYRGEHHAAVERSIITLKALTYRPTGGIVAAVTTSLPEEIGGPRNWDYRYCWLRDATFTLFAMMLSGYYEEAKQWQGWLLRAVAGSPDQTQIMYGIAGHRRLQEWEVDWLPGYENSRPVRIGNAASEQLQLDVYGEVMSAFYHAHTRLGKDLQLDYRVPMAMVEHLEKIWEEPDDGIWETRGARQQFTYSKVMAWTAFDRAIRIAEEMKTDAPVKRWKRVRAKIHKQVCERAYDAKLCSFVQAYGSNELDASLLLIPLVGFLPHDDERVRGTVLAIEKYLMPHGFVMRYNTAAVQDGLPPGEGVFLACSFWMVSNLKMLGRDADARKLFERVLSVANDVGLLAEEYDISRRRLVGNFPQALSHIALVNAAFDLFGRNSSTKQRLRRYTAPAHG